MNGFTNFELLTVLTGASTVVISIGALVVSVVALRKSAQRDTLAWRRDSLLPYYYRLATALKKLANYFFLYVPGKPPPVKVGDLATEAESYGLDEIAYYLKKLGVLIIDLKLDLHDVNEKDTIKTINKYLEHLESCVKSDINEIVEKKKFVEPPLKK